MKKILIIAGGSGGHVFPGLSVARYLINCGYKVVWLGIENQIESKLVPKYGIDIKFIRIRGWRGKNFYSKLVFLLFICMAIYQSFKIIRYWKPSAILSMGGYVSVPSGLAAWVCGVPLIIHEQNRTIGLANRFLLIFANKVLQGFPYVIKQAEMVGNPVSNEILSVPHPDIRWKNRVGPLRVLVIGGSKGARIFNTVIPMVAAKMLDKLIIWHQVGERDLRNVKLAYNDYCINQSNYKIVEFIEKIDRAYAWADVLISRSGALTVSEVAIVGLPAIFVPFVYHKDYQQYWNAIPLVQLGAVKIIEQKEFITESVVKILESWNRRELLDMAKRAKILAYPNATKLVSEIVINCLKQYRY